jgi:hypothetical protein
MRKPTPFVAGADAVAEEKHSAKKKGLKRGLKHTPGRGHTRKSAPLKKKRFRQKAAKNRQAQQDELRTQWDVWDSLSPELQKLRPDKKPNLPRPEDEIESSSQAAQVRQ